MKLCVISTHPIQYQVPLFRMLNQDPDIDVEALFLSDHSVKGGTDPGFGQAVKWDVPMLEGYAYRFLANEGEGVEGTGFRAYRTSAFRKLFLEMKPDAILVPGHGVMAYWQAVFTAHRLGIPVLVRPESLDGAQPVRPQWKTLLRSVLLRRFYNRISLFCATGYFSRKDAEAFGFQPERIVNAPYCIDTELFEQRYQDYAPQRDAIREELGMRPGDVGVVFMAKMIDWKNPLMILEAMATLSEGDRKQMFPILVGSGPDLDKVRMKCVEVMGEGRFCCPGFVNQSELCRYYAAGDVFVLPSKRGHESWGLVVNEAMTCGLPVVVSDGVGCRKDLVEQQGTGYVFSDQNPGELAAHLIKLAQDVPGRNQMADLARERIALYSSSEAAKGLTLALRRLTPEK